jgi:ABC-type oligopeptide transport system substrate-binding subunit
VVLERARNYWNAEIVGLERVRFVAARDGEAALAAYQAGEVDAVTNVNIEPLALKLLAPYQDFRRATFGALTYYDFNTTRPPFDDLRVRQSLSLAIDRERLSADTLDGATEAAHKFLPANVKANRENAQAGKSAVMFDAARARRLLAEAGFADGANFPRIRLLVNRNEQHRTVATAIAGMWRTVLGIETEIILRNWDEYEAALRAGEYDVARRSFVMQTHDETSNMLAMFDPERLNFTTAPESDGVEDAKPSPTLPGATAKPQSDSMPADEQQQQPQLTSTPAPSPAAPRLILSEQQALDEMPALPIYFASSYALVKPYVAGFDSNLLDAPSLQHVRIETNWQPPPKETFIKIVSLR